MTISSNNNHIQTYLNNDVQLNKTLERVATGLLLNKAADNAASLAISDNLRTEASGVYQSMENVNSALAMTQIGDKAMGEQSNILDSVKKDLLQASTDTTSQEGREALLEKVQKSLEQLNNIASQTNYNGTNLLQAGPNDTAASDSQEFQAGSGSSDTIATNSVQANTTGLGLDDLLNQDPSSFNASTARSFLDTVDEAINTLSSERSNFGSTANQLESSYRNLATQYTSTMEARSILTDVDYAKETSSFSKQNILAQVGAFSLAQSNVSQQNVLRLLQ